MFAVESVDDLWAHIAYVRVYAPDLFPVEDFLPADQQMDLERSFALLRCGVEVAYPEPSFMEKRQHLFSILERSYAAYKEGEEIVAGHLLNEFQDNIFKAE